MTLEEARADIERRFTVHPTIGDQSVSPTGEPYVVVTTGGPRDEGDTSRCMATSEAAAIDLWHEAMVAYVSGKGGTLYWRTVPVVDFFEYRPVSDEDFSVIGSRKLWLVYSRFLISEKPQRRRISIQERGYRTIPAVPIMQG